MYSLNKDYFKEIDTTRKAYWLGLIYADGNVQQGGTFSIGLKSSDQYLLESLATDVGYDGKIRSYKFEREIFGGPKKEYSSTILRISRKKFIMHLLDKGVHYNKTFRLSLPDLESCYYSHFVRGLFDGDGYISITTQNGRKHIAWGIVGQHELLNKVNGILSNELGIEGNPVRQKANENCYEIRYATHCAEQRRFPTGRIDDLVKIRQWLYKEADICLLRKKNIFDLLQSPPLRSGLSMREVAAELGQSYYKIQRLVLQGRIESYWEGMYKRIPLECFLQLKERGVPFTNGLQTEVEK